MGARHKLNGFFGAGAAVTAGYAGLLAQSWWAFAAVLLAGLVVLVRGRHIRGAGR